MGRLLWAYVLWRASFQSPCYLNRLTNPSQCYRKHENVKKRAYESRIQEIEHSSFTPLVMSSIGGLGPAATSTYKRLATLLAAKWDQSYTTHSKLAEMPPLISFSFLRSSIQAIRGARSAAGKVSKVPALPIIIDLVIINIELNYFALHAHVPLFTVITLIMVIAYITVITPILHSWPMQLILSHAG